jgi:hypothetical protein
MAIPFLFEPLKMGVKPFVGLAYQFTVKSLLASARFISCYQQDALALRIESKGHTPFAVRCGKPQLLHVGVAGAVKRIYARAAQPWPKLLKQARQSKNFCLHVFRQGVKFRLELVANRDHPYDSLSMPRIAYAVKDIRLKSLA